MQKKTNNVIISAEKIWQESMRGKRKLLGISILTQEMIVVEVNMYNREGYLAWVFGWATENTSFRQNPDRWGISSNKRWTYAKLHRSWRLSIFVDH